MNEVLHFQNSTFGEENGNLTNAIKNNPYLNQINPLRSFNIIISGISTDIKNIRTELNAETITLDVGQERSFINIDKDGKQIGEAFTLNDYLQNPSLASTKLFSNGIMNSLADAKTNAVKQLGLKENGGNATILYDPSSAPDVPVSEDFWGNFGGLLADTGEVSINYLGANVLGGAIQTKGQKTDQEFIAAAANNAKQTGETLTLAGHSGGGLRNYLTLMNSEPNQFLDANGNSVLAVQFSGTPANYQNLLNASSNAGVGEIKFQNKSGDTVGNVLGMNGSLFEAGWSAGHVFHLFEPKVPLTDIKLESPHGNYGCILSNCYSGQITSSTLKTSYELR